MQVYTFYIKFENKRLDLCDAGDFNDEIKKKRLHCKTYQLGIF